MERRANHHVLVVEDDAELRAALRAVLDAEGCPNSGADSGDAALELIVGGLEPCLVLLDLHMPGIATPDFLSRLRGLPGGARVPVVILTGFSDPPPKLAVDGFLRKPLPMKTLTRVLDQHCDCSIGRVKTGGDPHPHSSPRRTARGDKRGAKNPVRLGSGSLRAG